MANNRIDDGSIIYAVNATGSDVVSGEAFKAGDTVVVFLNGQQTPIVTMEQDFNNSGLRCKIELPHGVGVIGWRGAYKNAGA